MDFLEHTVLTLAGEDILAQTVPGNVRLVVNLTPVDTRTDVVVVLQDGRVIIVPQSACCPMERIVSINAIYTVSTTRVTESMAAVFIVVKMGTNVLKTLPSYLFLHWTIYLLLEEQLAPV